MSAIELGVNYKFNSGAPSAHSDQPLPKIGGIGAASSLQVAARFPCLRLDRRLSWRRWRLRLVGICGNDGNPNHRRGSSARAVQLYGQRAVRRHLRGRQLSIQPAGRRRRGRLAALQPDRQQSTAGRERDRRGLLRRRIPWRSLHSVHDDQRRRVGSRPVRLRLGSLPFLRHRRLGLGRSFALLRSSRIRPFVTNATNANAGPLVAASTTPSPITCLAGSNTALPICRVPASSALQPTPPMPMEECRSATRASVSHTNLAADSCAPFMIATAAGGHDG